MKYGKSDRWHFVQMWRCSLLVAFDEILMFIGVLHCDEQSERWRKPMDCKNCKHELTAVAEMDEYQLCHYCYCKIMDTTNKGKIK